MATLADEFLTMHLHMARMNQWKMIDTGPREVEWGLWGAWGPCGFQRGKYETVKKHYIEESDLQRAMDRLATKSDKREWSSVAFPMGVGFDHRPRSPLRYRDGQCMCGVVFRLDGENKVVYPQATWRIVEITRRFLVDCAVLDYLFAQVMDGPFLEWTLGTVSLNLNVMWFSDYHAPLAEKWMPGLHLQGHSSRYKYYQIYQPHTKFKSRQIGNDLALRAKPMFDLKRKKLLVTYGVDDFPKG